MAFQGRQLCDWAMSKSLYDKVLFEVSFIEGNGAVLVVGEKQTCKAVIGSKVDIRLQNALSGGTSSKLFMNT